MLLEYTRSDYDIIGLMCLCGSWQHWRDLARVGSCDCMIRHFCFKLVIGIQPIFVVSVELSIMNLVLQNSDPHILISSFGTLHQEKD